MFSRSKKVRKRKIKYQPCIYIISSQSLILSKLWLQFLYPYLIIVIHAFKSPTTLKAFKTLISRHTHEICLPLVISSSFYSKSTTKFAFNISRGRRGIWSWSTITMKTLFIIAKNCLLKINFCLPKPFVLRFGRVCDCIKFVD